MVYLIRSVLCVLLVCSTLYHAHASTEYVGTLAGEFRVAESGAATYTVPITVPKARGDVAPQIALQYHSHNTREGLLGVGWQLSASSAITRCPSTPIMDSTITPIYFDTRDHFCLDGQRLVVSSGQKGHDGTTYHTDIDNFAVITSFDDNHDGHPRYFSVQTKSGETHYYGDVSHAPYPYRGEDALVLHPEQSHVAKAWMLKAIEDVAGNYIEFHYHSSAMSGAALLSHIQYGGHIQGDAPYIDVRFEYEHTGTGFSGYYFGMPVRNDQRLTDITVLQDGHTYRKYTLNYDVAAHLQAKTTLTSIVECAPRSGQQLSLRCKPATQFAWHGVPDTPYYQPFASAERWLSHHRYAEHRLFDINGDGVDDVVYEKDGAWRARITHFGDIHLSHVGAGSKERSYAMAFDGNVDGVMDLLVFHGSTVMYVYLDTHSRPVQVNTQMHIPFTDYQRGVISADVNGDGRSDLVYQQSGHVRALINPAGQGRWQRITLHAFAADDVVNLRLFDEAKDTTAAFDVNGDGRTDFVFELQKREYYCVFSGPIFNPRSMPRPLAEPAISAMRTEFDAFAAAEPGLDAGLDAGLDNGGKFECMRRGGRWVSQRYTTQEMFVSSGDMATPRLRATGTLGTASTEQMRPVDINGDGLSDIMYTLNGTWFYRISTGTYFRQGQSTGLSASNALSHRTHFVDINGDGRTDILHASRETQLDIYMSSPIDGVSDRVSFSRTGTRHVSANARIHLGLLNRDNHIDVLTYQRGTWSVYWGQQHPAVDTIHTITNGFGVSTEIDYRAQSDPAVYTLTQPRHSLPEQVIAPGRGPNLVYQVHTDSNVDIDSYTKERLSVRYHYRDALLHIAGRGVLGFGELQTQDRQTGVVTTTSYHQDASGQRYALIGMPLATTQTLNDKVLSTSTNTLAVKTTATGSLFPYIASSTDSIIHVDDDAQAVHEVGAIHTTYEYDDYGNLTYSKTEQYDRRSSWYTPYIRTETTNTYGSDENMQRLGRLTKTQVTHSSNVAGTNKRQSVFTYQANGLLQSSTVYGDSVTGNYHAQDPRYVGHHLKTLYAYDAYGQQTAQCTTDDISQTQVLDASSQSHGARCAHTEYSDDGRVISASINSLGERTTLDYDASHGEHLGIIYQVTTTTENGVSTRVHIDGFGRQVATTLPNGVIQRTSMGYTSSYAAHFYEQRTQPGQAPVTVYYDAWGREVASVTRKREVNDEYQDIVVKKTYDNQGRLASVSQPNDFTATTTTAYDVLGRPTSVTRPEGQVETVSRSNGAIITTNALGQVHTEQRDPFGQLRSTKDNLGNEVFFTYDVMGNLTRTSNSFNRQVIANTYDSWGRKINTTDPDKGTWRYKYNHYGELIEQSDAMGHRYDFTYDSLGRMV
ncbi:toxin TcdB middle/N-terminal domain-containing protein, partial [Opacimonas viscosa]